MRLEEPFVVDRWKAITIAVLFSTLYLFVGIGQSMAHASLVRSFPEANAVLDAAPRELRLWFSEAPEPRFSEVWLLDRTGRRVDGIGPLRPDAVDSMLLVVPLNPPPAGVYTASWRVTSMVDGHVTQGAFSFVIGRDQVPNSSLLPTAPLPGGAQTSGPTIPGTAIRWIAYLAMALLAGGFAFFPLALRPALSEAEYPRGDEQRRRTLSGRSPVDSRPPCPIPLFVALWLGWGLAVATTGMAAVIQAASGANVDLLTALGAPLQTLIGNTRYGAIFWTRLLILCLIFLLMPVDTPSAMRASASRRIWPIGLVLSAALLFTTSLSGHAAVGLSPSFIVVADWLHATAASIWVGGLVALFVTLRWARRADRISLRLVMPGLVRRFSRLAMVCVAIIAATGLYRAVVEIADWENLVDTAYGIALLIKLGILVPLLGLAAVNLLLVRRRVVEASGTDGPDVARQPWYRRLHKTVGGEILFASALLLATSALISLPPAREAFGPGLVLRGQGDDLRVVLVVNPGLPGINSFDVYLRDGARREITNATKVALIFDMVERDVGETEAVADNVGSGHYLAKGSYVSIAGTWRVQVLVRRQGRDDVRLVFPVVLAPHQGKPYERTQHTSSYSIRLSVTPGQVGENRLQVTLGDHQGLPIVGDTSIRLVLKPIDADVAAREIEARSIGRGRYDAEGVVFESAGNWQVTVAVANAGRTETARFTVVVP
ncbi:MAG: copper resistance protein CopC [Chloroflexi bacterium]|nr:copper resistance protein CopC [Chloroflexota bacterium]